MSVLFSCYSSDGRVALLLVLRCVLLFFQLRRRRLSGRGEREGKRRLSPRLCACVDMICFVFVAPSLCRSMAMGRCTHVFCLSRSLIASLCRFGRTTRSRGPLVLPHVCASFFLFFFRRLLLRASTMPSRHRSRGARRLGVSEQLVCGESYTAALREGEGAASTSRRRTVRWRCPQPSRVWHGKEDARSINNKKRCQIAPLRLCRRVVACGLCMRTYVGLLACVSVSVMTDDVQKGQGASVHEFSDFFGTHHAIRPPSKDATSPSHVIKHTHTHTS